MFDNNFYKNLKKPSFTPSPIVFKIVWPVLYVLMFCSSFIIISKETSLIKKVSLTLFGMQLFLNLIWSPLFFLMKKIRAALLVAVLMTIITGITMFLFEKISPISSRLLIPYFLWLKLQIFKIKFLKQKRNSFTCSFFYYESLTI